MIVMTKRRFDNALVTKAETAIAQANGMTLAAVNEALDQPPVGSKNKDRYLKGNWRWRFTFLTNWRPFLLKKRALGTLRLGPYFAN